MTEQLPQSNYIAGLASELHTLRQVELRAAEDELARGRLFRATAANFINNPAFDLAARQALATALGLHAPHDTPKETKTSV